MIVYKDWESLKKRKGKFSGHDRYYYQGFFLLGIFPLYIRRYYKGPTE